MIELLITSLPFVLWVWHLRRRGIPITLYNVHVALFVWLALAFGLFFTLFYYYPKSYTGIVPFQTVPVVAEAGGTVTGVMVGLRQHVEPGQILFTIDDASERAAVQIAEKSLEEVNRAYASAEEAVNAAKAARDRTRALLENANQRLADQETLRQSQSGAFRANTYDQVVASQATATADVAAADAKLHSAEVELTSLLPARRESALAAVDKAKVDLDKTRVRALVPGVVEQLTLSVGNRGSQFASNPAMVIVPDEQRRRVIAGFSQVARSVLHVGMPAEIACDSNLNMAMTNAIMPARVTMIQDAIAAGQLSPTGRLIEPSERAARGDVVVYFEPEYSEHKAMLVNGAGCTVQTYSASLGGVVGHAIAALGLVKASLLRMKVWIALIVGVGLGGSH